MLALVALAACWGALPSGASAAPMPLSSGSVWAGGGAFMTIVMAAPASECRLTAIAPNRMRLTLSQVAPTGTKITWVWQVPRTARSASWRLLASCGSSRVSAVLTVHGRQQQTALALARQIYVLEDGGAFTSPAQIQADVAAQSWWASDSTSILSTFHSGPATGQCTDYVAAQRPDIIERVDTWAYSRYLLAGSGGLDVNWAARYWAANAQEAGIPTGNFPQPGAVIVFQPHAYGAFSDGHVAIVDSVGKAGSFTISAMHAPVVGRVTSRHFSARSARAMAASSAVTFIYS